MRQFIHQLRQRMADLWSFVKAPFEVTIDEYDTVLFIKNGRIIRASGKKPASKEQLEHFRNAFRSMDRAFDSMDDAFKEMDEAFQHMERTTGKKE